MDKLLEKDLSYQIVGILYDVYNDLGGGYQEKYYERAVAKELKSKEINFKEQVMVLLEYKGESIGKYFFDFLIEDKIILELKATIDFYPRDVKQVLSYLKKSRIDLGILANFTRNGLRLKRVLRGF